MTARGRILAISLIERTAKKPEYAKQIGLKVYMKEAGQSGEGSEKKNV